MKTREDSWQSLEQHRHSPRYFPHVLGMSEPLLITVMSSDAFYASETYQLSIGRKPKEGVAHGKLQGPLEVKTKSRGWKYFKTAQQGVSHFKKWRLGRGKQDVFSPPQLIDKAPTSQVTLKSFPKQQNNKADWIHVNFTAVLEKQWLAKQVIFLILLLSGKFLNVTNTHWKDSMLLIHMRNFKGSISFQPLQKKKESLDCFHWGHFPLTRENEKLKFIFLKKVSCFYYWDRNKVVF